jgi:LmbE family N-acetylglucosaminyl deacetylase
MKWKVDSALVLSAHTDDMEIGAGATVRWLVESGVKVKSVVFSDCKDSVDLSTYPEDILRKECKAAAKHLGITDLSIHSHPVRRFPSIRQEILETIYKLRKEGNYDLVLTTWIGDIHQDHRVVAEETLRAFMKSRATILSYPIPGNCPGFTPNVYFPVSEEMIEKKIEMEYLYESQVAKRFYFAENAIKGWMSSFGIDIGMTYAEAFALQKEVVESIIPV